MDAATSINRLNGSEIAIIGMVCRFPGARSVEEFWRNLRDGVESISFLRDEELEPSGVDPAQQTNPHYVKAASVLDEVEWFDAAFFGLTPREAEIMDPQQRLFLECAWEALEQAGYDPETYPGEVGLFAGARTNTYLFNIYSHQEIVRSLGAFQIGLGNDFAFLSTRVSYKLNLRGPSYSVHTACSTSLVAVHLACQSLLTGECQIALAGGVAISVPQKTGYMYQPGGIVSPDGHCRAFDAKAQGTIFGSGVGIVVLKRLEDAIADGDTIHAVIKGSAVNNDGSLKASFTAPSVQSQTEVIAEAIAQAEVEPETITYVEAHGTGTSLGDAIEIRALTKAFRAHADKKVPCAIGSVKTNFGHLDAAAGAAGLLKTTLSLKHGMLPPTLHFEAPHPNIDFANSPFYVNARLSEWKRNGTPRRAGVSSFGVGGTNAHIVLEEAPPREESGPSRLQQLIVLSAQSPSALETMTANLAAHLKQHPELKLADVAYTLGVGRKAFGFRRILVERTVDDAASTLETLDSQRLFSQSPQVSDPPVVFMFPGQGAQYVQMGLELYRTEQTFRELVDQCSELLRPHLGLDLRTVLYPSGADEAAAQEQLTQTWLTQPALFVIEYALARLWMEWGVRPQAMIGHSIGEYVAACLAGVLTLEDALALVAIRGRLMQELPEGAMLAVPLSEQELRPLMNGRLYLAAINEPRLCVASGPSEAVAELELELAQRGLASRRLQTSHAFHSQMMEPVVAPFMEQIERLSLGSVEIPYISNVTGTWMNSDEAADPEYWGRHLRQTVRFADGLEVLLKESGGILLEVGPGQTLSRLVKRHPGCPADQVVLSSMRPHDGEQSDEDCLITTLGQLWLNGVGVDWPGFYRHERRHRVTLPTYPFERQRYWIFLQSQHEAQAAAAPVSSGKEPDIADWFYRPSWRPTPLLRSSKAASRSQERECWLVFSDEGGLGAALAVRLQEEGQEVVTVLVGEQFSQVSDTVFTINPEAADDYRSLFRELCAQGKTPSGVLHLWGITTKETASSRRESFTTAQVRGFYSLLYVARAVRSENLTDPMQLWVVSNGLRQVESQDVLCPEKTTILGACTVIPQEFANLTCRTIDLVVSESDADTLSLQTDQIIAEMAARTGDVTVAYRGSHRWVQSFEPMRLDGETEPIRPLRERGVYLITGGMGGVGLLVAEYLARTVQARLILTSRTAYPKGSERDEWLATHGEEDGVSQKIRQLRMLEELGASVEVVSADVADEGQMRSLIAQIYHQYGELNGVLHAAGITSGPSLYVPVTEIGPAEADLQFQPKVYGVYVLEKVLQGRDLDFCLLFSSNAAVLGGMGLVAYSAANHFMDAFACHQSRRGRTSWISANWDPWPEETKKYEGVRTSVDKYAMTPEESMEAFRRVACISPDGQVVVATGAFQARLDQWVKSNPLQSAAATTSSPAPFSAHPRLNLQIDYVAPRNESERLIADIWQQVLGVQQVGIDDNFFDLGGHSLLMIQVQSKLREALHKEISMVDLFKYPSVGALAEYLNQTNGHKSQTEPEQERIEKQIEALNRKKELRRERAAFSPAEAASVSTTARSGVPAQPVQKAQGNNAILSMLAELSENGADEFLVKPTRIKRFAAEEEINSFGERLVNRLRGKVSSIMYTPHPFTRGAFVVVTGGADESLVDYLAEAYLDAPPDAVVYCLRRSELSELSLDGLFVPPSINQKPHLIYWLKQKGTALYGEDVREQIGEPTTDPRLLLESHITGCMLYMRELIILPSLWKQRYVSLVKELDRHLRYLMGTALLVHREWDVEVETLPRRFEQFYPDGPTNRAFQELNALVRQAEGMEESACRELALEAVWQFESFLRHFRRCVR
ncbi:MAG TPA: SDR family oxidoreductase [Pyrinomonadaceae bacterium]|jgi:acyl transferase domain-containing protein/acyl carrier protein